MIKMLTTISSDEFVVKAGEQTDVFSDQEEKNLIEAELAEAVEVNKQPKKANNKGKK